MAELKPPHDCKYCGQPSWVDPSDQTMPPGYCHSEDHGEPPVATGLDEDHSNIYDDNYGDRSVKRSHRGEGRNYVD